MTKNVYIGEPRLTDSFKILKTYDGVYGEALPEGQGRRGLQEVI